MFLLITVSLAKNADKEDEDWGFERNVHGRGKANKEGLGSCALVRTSTWVYVWLVLVLFTTWRGGTTSRHVTILAITHQPTWKNINKWLSREPTKLAELSLSVLPDELGVVSGLSGSQLGLSSGRGQWKFCACIQGENERLPTTISHSTFETTGNGGESEYHVTANWYPSSCVNDETERTRRSRNSRGQVLGCTFCYCLEHFMFHFVMHLDIVEKNLSSEYSNHN